MTLLYLSGALLAALLVAFGRLFWESSGFLKRVGEMRVERRWVDRAGCGDARYGTL